MELYCKICNKQFHRPPSKLKSYEGRQANKYNFCSRKCYIVYWKKRIGQKGKNHWKWKGGKINSICANCGKNFSIRRKGKNRKYKFCSKNCLHIWLEGRFVGTKNPNWKGSPPGISRNESKSIKWRRAVFERDNWTCQKCGSKKDLNAHHIKSYAKFPKLRYRLNNGITLCKKCHIEIHKKKLIPERLHDNPLSQKGEDIVRYSK